MSSCFSNLLGVFKLCLPTVCLLSWRPIMLLAITGHPELWLGGGRCSEETTTILQEKNSMEAQTQARTCQSHSSGADQVTSVPRLCSVDRQFDRHKRRPPPRPHVSAERPECQYGVVFTYRYTQNSHLNTTGSKNTCIQKHFRHMRTHSSVLSSRTASMSGRRTVSRTPRLPRRE